LKKTYKVLSPQDLESVSNSKQEFALEVLLGLSKTEKSLPSRYFYDDKGSSLFQKIMELDEYYLSRCEHEILEKEKDFLSEILQDSSYNLIDLGSGDGRKTNILIEEFLSNGHDFNYVPVDISEAAIKNQLGSLEKQFPNLNVSAIVAEYFNGLLWHTRQSSDRNVLLFLGSNIGNFRRSQARTFLHSVWNFLNDGDLVIIGFDLKKDIELMMQAYNDHKGVTKEFNLNLLERINRELGGEFKLDQFRHFAHYNVFSGAMESYIVSLKEQEVQIKELNQTFKFKPFEPIHTEYSYKFLPSDIESLAKDTGYSILRQMKDSQGHFVDSIWEVQKTL